MPGPEARARIVVAIAGEPDCAPALRAVLAGQLADIAAAVSWSCQPRFAADEPFRDRPKTNAWARVWVDLSAVDDARLILEDARDNRFFVRRLPLANGLDEIGREEIAQVVRAATIAVMTGEPGVLTRAQARVTASGWPAPAPRPASPVAPASTPPVAPSRAERVDGASPGQAPMSARERLDESGTLRRRGPSSPRAQDLTASPGSATPSPAGGSVEIGPAWTAQTLAPEIPASQEIALSLALAGRGSRLSFWMDAGYGLAAMYDDAQVGVSLKALSARAGIAVWTARDRAVAIGLGAGLGAKRIWFAPRGNATAVDPASPDRFDTFAGRVFLAARLEASRRLSFRFDLLCDVPTADVHFDFRDADGVTQRALTEWPVQPGLRLAARWRWGD